jgi:hypothetical protein
MTDLFFPDRGEKIQAAEAIEICHTCPVSTECFFWAVRNNEKDGIWGGVLFTASRRHHERERLIALHSMGLTLEASG